MAITVASALTKRWRAALTWLLLSCAGLAPAHPMPESRVWIDTTPAGMNLTLQLPLNRLEFAFGQPLAQQPATVLAQHGDALAAYLLQHVGARSDGLGWQVFRPQLNVVGNDASAELEAVFELRAPQGASARTPTLLYDVINHEVRTHRALVFLRNDWRGGYAGQAPLLLGELSYGANTLPLPLQTAPAFASIQALLLGGAEHIAAGTDHLLFLLMLLLVAPLAPRARRWAGVRPLPLALRHTALVITCFTVGHTITLMLGSSGLLALPSQPVEVAVAATIVVAALHAWRPLFARAEAWMALAFGLIHGMAFSASLSGAGLTPGQHAQALLAFNLGIEGAQLAGLLLVLPPLLMLGRARAGLYATLRRLLAAAAGALALAWVMERAGLADIGVLAGLDDVGLAVLAVPGLFWGLALLFTFTALPDWRRAD